MNNLDPPQQPPQQQEMNHNVDDYHVVGPHVVDSYHLEAKEMNNNVDDYHDLDDLEAKDYDSGLKHDVICFIYNRYPHSMHVDAVCTRFGPQFGGCSVNKVKGIIENSPFLVYDINSSHHIWMDNQTINRWMDLLDDRTKIDVIGTKLEQFISNKYPFGLSGPGISKAMDHECGIKLTDLKLSMRKSICKQVGWWYYEVGSDDFLVPYGVDADDVPIYGGASIQV